MIEILAVCYAFIAVVATIIVVRSEHLERMQTVLQLALVWLIPFIGAIIVLVFHSVVYTNMTTKAQPHQSSNNSNEPLAYDLQQELDR